MSAKQKRILVVTDSLGLPRAIPETCHLDASWPRLLASKYDVVQISIGGGTIGELYRQVSGYYNNVKPDVVIIQSGIVDCAPRSFSKKELDFFIMTKAGRFFLRVMKPYSVKLRKLRKKKYTKPADYSNFFSKFISLFECPILCIETISGNNEYEKKVPGIIQSVKQYNDILINHKSEKFCIIPTGDFTKEDVMSDHIHLTEQGCSKLFEKICATLND